MADSDLKRPFFAHTKSTNANFVKSEVPQRPEFLKVVSTDVGMFDHVSPSKININKKLSD